jgi:ATP-dependent helicase/nuclease subunit A
LFVALSRTRDHLVVPLPRDIPGSERPRDRWLESIRDGLEFDGTPAAGTYSIDVEAPGERTRSIDVAVNAVDTLTTHVTHDDAATPPPFTATSPPEKDDLPGLVPRILRPSTIYPLSEEQEANILDHLQGRPLHTDTDTIDDELPLTLNEFDTEDVGSFVHGVLTQCVDHNISAHDLRGQSATVERIIDDQLHHHGPPANQAERDGLIEFLTQFVLPDFVTSKLWKQLERADTVIVEKPLRMHIRRDNVEFEVEGQADFLLQNPDGSWSITDAKIALTDMNTETRRRYEIQVSCYATLFAAESGVDGPINCAIETFGSVTDRQEVPFPSSELQESLDTLLGGGK